MSTPEGKIKDRFKREMELHLPSQFWRFMPVQTGFGSVAHDFIICYDGLFFTVEAKANVTKSITALQNSTKNAIEAAGGIFLLVYDNVSITAAVNRMKYESEKHGRSRSKTTCPDVPAQDQGEGEQHLRQQLQGQAPERAAGGDHGAPRTASQGHSQPAACVYDPEHLRRLEEQDHICDHECVMAGCPPRAWRK